jgi:transcription initiation factor IIE alpha subunit
MLLPEIDWSSDEKFAKPLITCECGETYFSQHKAVHEEDSVRYVSKDPCPGCGKQIDNFVKASYGVESKPVAQRKAQREHQP